MNFTSRNSKSCENFESFKKAVVAASKVISGTYRLCKYTGMALASGTFLYGGITVASLAVGQPAHGVLSLVSGTVAIFGIVVLAPVIWEHCAAAFFSLADSIEYFLARKKFYLEALERRHRLTEIYQKPVDDAEHIHEEWLKNA